MLGGFFDLSQMRVRRLAGVGLAQAKFGVTQDDGEHVVEVMRHAAGKAADRLQLLGMHQLALQPLPLGQFPVSLGDVADDRAGEQRFALPPV